MDPVEAKMSKSTPNSAVFLHDSPAEISKKLKGAFCPPEAEGNPVLDMVRLVTFPKLDQLRIERSVKYGGPVEFKTMDELIQAYSSGKLHPQDLKKGAADSISEVLAPVRKYFEENPKNLDMVKALSVTR